jgi:hypothetical protein
MIGKLFQGNIGSIKRQGSIMRKTKWVDDAESFANWEYVPPRKPKSALRQVGSGLLLAGVGGVSAAVVVIGLAAIIKWVMS